MAALPSSPASTKAWERPAGVPVQSRWFWRTTMASSRTSGRRKPPALCSTAWYHIAMSAARAMPPPPGTPAARIQGWLNTTSISSPTPKSGISSKPSAASSSVVGTVPTPSTSATPAWSSTPMPSHLEQPTGSITRSVITSAYGRPVTSVMMSANTQCAESGWYSYRVPGAQSVCHVA